MAAPVVRNVSITLSQICRNCSLLQSRAALCIKRYSSSKSTDSENRDTSKKNEEKKEKDVYMLYDEFPFRNGPTGWKDKDPGPLFLNPKVYNSLRKMTGFDLEKLFPQRPYPRHFKPKFRIVSDEKLQKLEGGNMFRAQQKLQMPPVMLPRTEESTVICHDTCIAGLYNSKMVITDLMVNTGSRERIIVIREPNGVLRTPTLRERDRITQVYFPRPGRTMMMSRMFYPEYMQGLLDRDEHQYLLDRACVQFEPDDPQFIRICQEVYDHLYETRKFDILRSTRHFGPMAFYYAYYDKIERLLVDMIQREFIQDAGSLVKVLNEIHPDAKCAQIAMDLTPGATALELVKAYLEANSEHKLLAKAVEDYEKLLEHRQKESERRERGLKGR
ncbi:28S ribosomal protein S22, mitochondrial [Lingula anatina]|uniref:28S ribosomal protein S22, mitochondrial n=1 Tax=Lingula anatina TaxID=7574 RepID=A0A1S3J1G6_LINAN|nr:28S ribosomal protein S22, mitochondrial [Lingula anatina]|eukprot:XP_013404101.1 28S ribosomal protein S22, mitochondrial [Lingula anatina]